VETVVSHALILEFYEQLTKSGNLNRFGRKVLGRYTEGTLQRLLSSPDDRTVEAALVALRLHGTMESNKAVAACLHHSSHTVHELAEAALWAIWFRGDSEENNRELQRLAKLITDKEYAKALAGLNALAGKCPDFAEVYNQRAILYWRWGEYKNSIADCERTLRLNPVHFGAQAGMAQCFLQLKKPVEALKAFRLAYKTNPGLEGVHESIRTLEQVLREERRRNDGRK
jgi:tetratricopeptide (TPR) repeat protein